ncbi:MAG: DinB family protein [Hymenobacter sp.]|nr:DinB family protein [Hymenobacter sp.]
MSNFQTASPELDRFIALHDQQVQQMADFVGTISHEIYAAIPVDSPALFLGSRVKKITIGGLVRHLILAEAHWFAAVKTAADGDTIPLPQNAALLEGVPDGGPLLDKYAATYAVSLERLRSLTAADLTKRIVFVGRQYTVMGFLWTVLGHHGFHLGQLDLLLRQQGIEAPEYMEWAEQTAVIA